MFSEYESFEENANISKSYVAARDHNLFVAAITLSIIL